MSELMELLQTIHWIKAKAGTGCTLSDPVEIHKLFREIKYVAEEALEEAHQTGLVAQAEQSMVGNMTAPWRGWKYGREMFPGVTNYDCGQHPDGNAGIQVPGRFTVPPPVGRASRRSGLGANSSLAQRISWGSKPAS